MSFNKLQPYKFALILLILSSFGLPDVVAQEFNCTVTINDDQLDGNTFDYLGELKPQLENYINEYSWTDFEYLEHERIDCQFQIIIRGADQDFNFSAEAILFAQRPVYNTTAQTTLITLSDNSWQFNYPQGQSLIHDELQFDALSGFVDFFMYILLGYDYDSFSPLGGQPYFQKAQDILTLAQSTSATGWNQAANNRRNRFTLATDLVNPSYEPLRMAYYDYHRKGLDTFTQDPEGSRQNILDALKSIQTVKRRTTSNYLYDLFFDTKAREIASIFQDATSPVKLEAYNVLQQIDQSHLSEYQTLQN